MPVDMGYDAVRLFRALILAKAMQDPDRSIGPFWRASLAVRPRELTVGRWASCETDRLFVPCRSASEARSELRAPTQREGTQLR